MKLKNKFTLGLTAVCLLIGASVVARAQDVIFDETETDRATHILGLTVSGNIYDVTFTEYATASEVYGEFPGNYEFTSFALASAAMDAVNAALNGESAVKVGANPREIGELDFLYRIGFESEGGGDLQSSIFWEGIAEEGPPWVKPADSDIDCYTLCARVWAKFTFVSGNPVWPEANDLGGGWWDTWLGVLYVGTFPWVYHDSLDYLWIEGNEPTDVWTYSDTLDWMWTADGEYPFLWSSAADGWYWYDETSADPVWFYNFATEAWESFDLTP